jgi:hypothetical protein
MIHTEGNDCDDNQSIDGSIGRSTEDDTTFCDHGSGW